MNTHDHFTLEHSRDSRGTTLTSDAPRSEVPSYPSNRASYRSTVEDPVRRAEPSQKTILVNESTPLQTRPKAERVQTTCWPVILAGGEGARLRPFVQKWLGNPRPKQYCTFLGSRTMLQHTLDRALGLSERDHIVTILGKGHRRYFDKEGESPIPGIVIDQPFNLGTATGVFLAAVYVCSRDPDATMVLLPSDHFVYPEERFLSHLSRMRELAEQFEDAIILLGANPIGAETEYGWIEPREDLEQTDGIPGNVDYSKVHSFHEKPDRNLALEFYRGGFLWNTMVVAVKVRTLLRIGWRLLPTMMERFDELYRALCEIAAGRIGAEYEPLALSQVYKNLEEADFSRDILQAVARECIVHRMEGVDWSDWGQPQRIAESLERIGRKGNFPPGLLERRRRWKPLALAE